MPQFKGWRYELVDCADVSDDFGCRFNDRVVPRPEIGPIRLVETVLHNEEWVPVMPRRD